MLLGGGACTHDYRTFHAPTHTWLRYGQMSLRTLRIKRANSKTDRITLSIYWQGHWWNLALKPSCHAMPLPMMLRRYFWLCSEITSGSRDAGDQTKVCPRCIPCRANALPLCHFSGPLLFVFDWHHPKLAVLRIIPLSHICKASAQPISHISGLTVILN